MRQIFLYIVLFLATSQNVISQTWHQYYNNFTLIHFQQLSDNNKIIVGSTNAISSIDSINIAIIFTDSIGSVIWSKLYGGNGNDFGNYVIQLPDSGFMIAGNTTSFNSINTDILLIKTDKFGSIVWSKAYGGDSIDEPKYILPTFDGGYTIGGHSLSETGSGDVFLMHIDSTGNVIWNKSFGDADDNDLSSLEITNDSAYLIVSNTGNFSSSGYFNFYVIKVDQVGNVIWERAYGTSLGDGTVDGHQTFDGGYVLCGVSGQTGNGMYVIKCDSTGAIQWSNEYGTSSTALSIIQTTDSGFIFVGSTNLVTEFITSIIKLDKTGDTLWTNSDSEYQWDVVRNIRQESNGYVIGSNGFLFKVDSLGNSNCNGRSLSYPIQPTNTIIYTTSPHSYALVWNPSRTISVDTATGLNSTPGCLQSKKEELIIDKNTFTVFPNPVTENFLTLSLPKLNDNYYSLQLIDANGKIQDELKIYPTTQEHNSLIRYIFPRLLINGIYFIRCISNNSEVIAKFSVLREK